MITNYENPMQVKFLDFDATLEYGEPYWTGGIAYSDFIICGCCGVLCDIEELYEEFEENKEEFLALGIEEPIVVYKEWVDISDSILD